MRSLNQFLAIAMGFLLLSCSKDDGEKKLTVPPPIMLATEITSTSFRANWESVKGASFYKLQVSENINFTLLVSGYNDVEVSGTSLKIEGLDAAKKYFYRVKAGNSMGVTEYSQIAAGRRIDKSLVYNILWKGDEIRSNVNFDLMDMTFGSTGTFTGSASSVVISTGTWTWNDDADIMMIQSSTGDFEILFVDVTDIGFVGYFSALTDELAYFDK